MRWSAKFLRAAQLSIWHESLTACVDCTAFNWQANSELGHKTGANYGTQELKYQQHLPDRVDSQPGTYEENCKHCKQEVAQYLTFGVIGHLGSLCGEKKKKKSVINLIMLTTAYNVSDNLRIKKLLAPCIMEVLALP